jgi:hypothetical protein
MKKKQRSTSGLYRDGKLLVIREGTRCPGRCAICNKEDEVELVDFTFARERQRYVEVAAVQSIARAASDLATGARYTGPVQADLPLCAWHQGRRLRLFGIGAGMTVLGIAFVAIQRAMGAVIVPPGELGFMDIALYNWIAFAAVLTGVVFMLMCVFDSSKLWFKPTKYYGRFVWLAGAGPEFLATLPAIQPQDYKAQGALDASVDEANLSAEELIRRAGLDDD